MDTNTNQIEELSKAEMLSPLVKLKNAGSIDDYGRVFDYGENIYRGIFEHSADIVDSYFSSGLIEELEEKNLFPRTVKTNYELQNFSFILQHEKVNNVSYIFEWSFEMIKDVAFMILDVLDTAVDYGFSLKDSHPYNVLFHNNRPVWVDFTSLVKSENLTPWTVVEFYKSIYQPLELMTINPKLARECYERDAKYLWPQNVIPETWVYKRGFNRRNVKASEKFYQRLIKLITRQGEETDKGKIHEGIARYKDKIGKLKLSVATEWDEYQGDYVNEKHQIIIQNGQLRFLKIANIVKALPIRRVVEFACNRGMMSAILAEQRNIEKIVCIDYDDRAIDACYNLLKSDKLSFNCRRKMFPMVIDFKTMDDYFTGHGGDNNLKKSLSERIKGDAVFALAMTHHLLLTQKIPIDIMFERFKKFTNRFIFIEFMPLGLAVKREDKWYAPPIPDWYNEKFFVSHMARFFNILYRNQSEENRILYIGEVRD